MSLRGRSRYYWLGVAIGVVFRGLLIAVCYDHWSPLIGRACHAVAARLRRR